MGLSWIVTTFAGPDEVVKLILDNYPEVTSHRGYSAVADDCVVTSISYESLEKVYDRLQQYNNDGEDTEDDIDTGALLEGA